MAKKQPTNKKTGKGTAKGTAKGKGKNLRNTSDIITNTFIKGMVKDTDASYFSKDNWFHARNAINNSIDGDVGVIGNEPANLRCAKIPYAVIGGIHLYGDTWVIFSTNSIQSEIGFFDDSKCEYTLIVNDPCLNFTQEHLITGVSKENFDCTWSVYWDDGLNPSRILNVNDVPYVQIDNTPAGSSCTTYINEQPLSLDCEKIRLAPLVDLPCITLSKADEAGLLENGSYQVFIAYTINDVAVTDYIGISNIQPVWSHEDTNGSLVVSLSNLDKDFDWMTVAIRRRVKGQAITDILGVYSTETTEINIDYINKENKKLLSSNLQRRNPIYEKSDGMYVVNDYLIRTQPTEVFDFNYQPLANQIGTYWTSTQYPDNYYFNGGNKPTLLRDEQYAFFIRFIYNTGEKSNSYHIPGRAATLYTPLGSSIPLMENALIGGINAIDSTDQVFKVHNTATSDPLDPFVSTLIGNTSDDGGTIIGGGQMGYWESSELYPSVDTSPARWNSNTGNPDFDLCGTPIRHHKIPEEATGGGTTLTGINGDTINVIGVAFDNIAPPVYNDGTIIPNIVGYEIMVGGRAAHRSILGKGILKNTFNFRKDQDDGRNPDGSLDTGNWSWEMQGGVWQQISGTGTGIMPNYSYNDLRCDPYLILRNQGAQSLPWVLQAIGGYGDIEDNWLRGNTGGPGDQASRELRSISPDTYTIHAPDLNFSRLYLNPSEIKIYKTIQGPVTGRFKKSEDHPRAKLLKNRAATVAALIGTGYALKEMRGKRNYKINTMRSFSEGYDGITPGVHLAPVPSATGQSAANTLASAPGIFAGAVADYGFNLIVDGAAIFGAGKDTYAAGVPFYQLVENESAALAAGHIGPQRSIEYEGSDFTSVFTLMSLAVGIISFLNYTAVGGDKIVDLILNLMSYKDYAYKYISHGYYNQENQFLGAQFRIGVDRARYIKQAIQSFDGQMVVNNGLRPSTVVVRTVADWGPQVINPSGPVGSWPVGDNTKFTIGAGPCAGDGIDSMSWWNPGAVIRSTAVVNYVALKVTMDNQYGQLDQIIQFNTQGCFNFKDQQITDANGDLLPITPMNRFLTSTVYAGDSYISRYTEKAIMPFFYLFLTAGNDGLPFDYSKYANVPFPRYWMNTEKFEMSEFIRPIMDLDFNWSGSSEALPSAYYNMDTPDNGGYCARGGGCGVAIGGMGEGLLAGTSLQDGTAGDVGNNNQPTGVTPISSSPSVSAFTDPQDPFNQASAANGNTANCGINNRYQVVTVTGSNMPYNLDIIGNGTLWQIIGPCNSTDIIPPTGPTGIDTIVNTVTQTPGVNITITDFTSCPTTYNTPLWSGNNATIGITSSFGCTWDMFLSGNTAALPIPSSYSGEGTFSVRVIWDWSIMSVISTTDDPVGNYAAEPAKNKNTLTFSNNADYLADVVGGPGGPATLIAGEFAVNGSLTANIQDDPEDIMTFASSGSAEDILDASQDAFDASMFGNASTGTPNDKPTGGLFVVKTGYMYTHNCGINDFWVETDMNLAYRDWEDVIRKRHYDNSTYTDLVELFHAEQITYDNYYFYDKSTSVYKFWGTSWAQVQKRYYDPLIAEDCYVKYPKRILYSAPSTGWIDKANLATKNDSKQDFWRVFLTENFRDFKSKVTTVKTINQTGAMIFFPTLSPKSFQGQDRLQLSNTKITIGDGGLFSQAFQNVANSDVSHEYGSCESARSVLNTPHGLFFVSQAQGKIFVYSSKGIQAISDMGMKWWFNKFLPSKLLEVFPAIEDCPQAVDNPLIGAGVQTVYDPNNSIVYFTKKDYMPLDQYVDTNCIKYDPCNGFYYNATACGGLSQIKVCPEGYTLITDALGKEVCELSYQAPPMMNQSLKTVYGIAKTGGVEANISQSGSSRYGRDMPIVIDDADLTGMPTDTADPTTWHNITSSWWRNENINSTDGLVNQLSQGISNGLANTTNGWFAVANFSINIPVTEDDKILHLLVSADSYFKIEMHTGLGWADYIRPTGSIIETAVNSGIWQNDPGFSWLAGEGTQMDQYVGSSKIWIYKITLPQGSTTRTQFRIRANQDAGFQSMIGAAVIDVDDWEIIQNATQWSDLPKLFSSDVDSFMLDEYKDNIDYRCNPEYQESPEAFGDINCPVCTKEEIVYSCECEVDSTSNIQGTLFGLCPVNDSWGESYCEYKSYKDYTLEDQIYEIKVTDENYFKDISWTVSYDPKSRAWISFHDWHPELTFNSINHFLTAKSEITNIPQCPPGYIWDPVSQECCLSLHAEFPAEVFVDEFISDPIMTLATVDAFSKTIDVAIVIDNSGSTSPAPTATSGPGVMLEQLAFATEFINGMSAGMTGGAYPTQVRIGHGYWNENGTPGGTAPAVVTFLTANPVTAAASLTTANYPSGGGTCFDDAVTVANLIMANGGTPSTATNKVVIFITDATSNSCGTPSSFVNVTECISIYVSTSDDLPLSPYSTQPCLYTPDPLLDPNWVQLIAPMVSGTGLSAPANVPVCNENLYHLGSMIPLGNPGAFDTVAAAIVAQYITCTCSSGTIDLSASNPLCLPLPEPPPNCIECLCPQGYTMVGTCDNSNTLPICRLMECECPTPYFNTNEIVTQTGFCDDVTLWYNPNTGYGDPTYVNNDPLFCVYDYKECVLPNYEIGYFWKHNIRTDLFNNYYEKNYPWEIDIIETTGQQVTTVRSIEYQMEAFLYQNDSRDRFHDLDYNFDEAIIYNSEQVSGLLNLILEPKNNIQLSILYPIVNPNSMDILYSKEEQKYRFNMFWDITADRGEFSTATNTIWLTDWNGYIRNLNPTNLNYNKPQQQRKKFRHYFNHILLRKSDEMATTRKMLLKLENTKLNASFR